MKSSIGLGLMLVLSLAAAAAAKDPTDAEVQQWQQAAALTKAAEQKLGEFVADVEHKRTYANPFEYEGKYVDEKWTKLAAAEQELQPLREAIAAIEARFGGSAEAVEAKVWEEYGNPIDPQERGFSRRLSPDRKKWLSVDVQWPFVFYRTAKSCLEATAKWRQLSEDMAIEHVRWKIQTHEQAYGKLSYVEPNRAHVANLTALMPILDKVIAHSQSDPDLVALKGELEAKIEEWKAKTEALIDATEWKPHVQPFQGDPDAIVGALREHLKRVHDDREPLAVRISGDWEVYSYNLLGEPTCYFFWAEAAYRIPDQDDVAEVHGLKVYTPEGRGVNMGPPFGDVSHMETYLIRPGNVSQQGGGLFGLLLKVALGLACCFMFLAAVGGVGYFAYQQMNAQKAAAAGPGAPPPPAA